MQYDTLHYFILYTIFYQVKNFDISFILRTNINSLRDAIRVLKYRQRYLIFSFTTQRLLVKKIREQKGLVHTYSIDKVSFFFRRERNCN